MWTASSAIPRKLREKSDSEEKSHSTKGEVYEKKIKRIQAVCIYMMLLLLLLLPQTAMAKNTEKIQNHISGSGNS